MNKTYFLNYILFKIINVNDPKSNAQYNIVPIILEKENGEKIMQYASSVKIKNKTSHLSNELNSMGILGKFSLKKH